MAVFPMSSISLQCGDCLELMNNISDKSVDCIVTDLPYQQTSRNKWDVIIPFEPLWNSIKELQKTMLQLSYLQMACLLQN